MYNQLNQKLSEIKSGNYLIKITSIGDNDGTTTTFD